MTRVFQIALRGGEIPLCGKEEMGNFAGGGGVIKWWKPREERY